MEEQRYQIRQRVMFLDVSNGIMGQGKITRVALEDTDKFSYNISYTLQKDYTDEEYNSILNEDYIWKDSESMLKDFTKVILYFKNYSPRAEYLSGKTIRAFFKGDTE